MRAIEIKAKLRKNLHPRVYRALSKGYGYLRGSPKYDPPLDFDLALQEIGEPFASALASIYKGEPQMGENGRKYDVDPITKISVQEGLYLYHTCRKANAQLTMEIGCAYGFSTLYFLAAHATNSAGRHVAIDPFESSSWHGIGVHKVAQVAMQERFRLVEEPSFFGIPLLMREGLRFDIIFIDGSHFFESALMDFTLSANLCKMDGLIVLDDMWMPAIRKVVSFIRRNRPDFAEAPTSIENICVFRKVGEDRRPWQHFEDFD
ncbi:MAG TPA: class I SAM-dependent methyltransferase [Candidatus Acidoferrales bacterium]|nr:class I SAM-dependent methyltransferase [Candidatus Acidoferrales bacterium]